MSLVYVQFMDETMTVIGGFFGSPQPIGNFANYAEIEDTDPRWLAYLNPAPTLAQKQAVKDEKLKEASVSMTPMFLSLQLGDATDDETLKAKAWRDYYRALEAVDVTVADPVWPTPPLNE